MWDHILQVSCITNVLQQVYVVILSAAFYLLSISEYTTAV